MEDGRWGLVAGRADAPSPRGEGRGEGEPTTLDFGLWTPDFGLRAAYAAYAISVSIKKNVLSTSFLSAAQATDSTCSGWSANRPATKALRHSAPVSRRSRRNSNTAFAVWNSKLVR